MDFQYTEKVQDLINQVRHFINTEIRPVEGLYHEQLEKSPWETPPVMEELKEKARAKGLWNLFLPSEYGEYSAGLSNLEYAPLAEEMGRSRIASEAFNCAAPDTGNMEVLERYGTPEHKEKWLKPLLEGEIRSAYLMTEPDVASSDATNLEFSAVKDGDEWVLNGDKYWSSGAGDPRCKVFILMAHTPDENRSKHEQHSMFVVEAGLPGYEVIRPMMVFGHDDAPHGHMHIRFTDVRVPKENIILGEGRGFEIAQGRLGPGRIHHCMRLIGAAQRALELMCKRANERMVFGQPMIKHGSCREDIAKSACEIEQARLMTLKAADTMDRYGNKEAKELIAMIKIVAPNMALNVVDRAMQIHGAVGLSQDTPLAGFFAYARTLRLADGPDQVHMMQLGRNLAKKYE